MGRFAGEAEALEAIRGAMSSGQADAAFLLAERAIQEVPASPRLHALLAALCAEEGFGDEARMHARTAEMLAPGDPGRASASLALAKLGTPVDPEAFTAAHRAFAQRFIPVTQPHSTDARRPGATRVLFGGLDAHLALTRFVPGVLRHAPADVEVGVTCANHALLDFYRGQCPDVRIVPQPGDMRGAFDAIRAFAPDVLVDLAGHGPNNILPLLAHRCAARQVTWLDYLATTGLPAVDGRVTDAVADPDGNERWHVEPLLRLPVPPWSYEPWPEAPPVARVPADAPLRIGCACVPAKLNDATLALFRAVLEAIPGSTLRLVGFRSKRGVERVRARLGDALASRVTCRPRLPPAQYLAEIAGWDAALDATGFSGGTSTLDVTWCGVPIVTWPLVLSHTRSSASLLNGMGDPHCVASDAASYVECVGREIDADRSRPDRRDARRGRLRASSVGDAALFASHFFDAILARAQDLRARESRVPA